MTDQPIPVPPLPPNCERLVVKAGSIYWCIVVSGVLLSFALDNASEPIPPAWREIIARDGAGAWEEDDQMPLAHIRYQAGEIERLSDHHDECMERAAAWREWGKAK
jgi:hypothetical protein